MKVKKLVYGVGVNDADYVVQKWKTISCVNGKRKQKLIWRCSFYKTWSSMLERCCSTKFQERRPTYRGCSVSEEWLTFSNFKSWMEKQDWENNQLDKDLLVEGNKVYSPDTCVFVSPMINSFTTDSGAARGEWQIGVYWHKRANKFMSQCSNPFTNKREYLGLFNCEQQAHRVWIKRKLELAKKLAEMQTNERVAEALISRYSKYKEIVDLLEIEEELRNAT